MTIERRYDNPLEALTALEREHAHTRRVALARGVSVGAAPTERLLAGTVALSTLDRAPDPAPGQPGPGAGAGTDTYSGSDGNTAPDPDVGDGGADEPTIWRAAYNLGGPAAGDYSPDIDFLVTPVGDTEVAAFTETVTGDDAPQDVLRSERWNAAGTGSLEWTFPVEHGLFRLGVEVVLAENWDGAHSTGARLLDIAVDGDDYHRDVDTFSEVGAHTAQVITTVVEPGDDDTVTVRISAPGTRARAQAIRLYDAVNVPVSTPLGTGGTGGGGGTTQPPTDMQALFEQAAIDQFGPDWRNRSDVVVLADSSPSNAVAQAIAQNKIALLTTSRQWNVSRVESPALGWGVVGEDGTRNTLHAGGATFGVRGGGGSLLNVALAGQNLNPGASTDGLKAAWAGHRSAGPGWFFAFIEYGDDVMSGLRLGDGSTAIYVLNTGSRRDSMQADNGEGQSLTVREHLALGVGVDRIDNDPPSFEWAKANPHLANRYEGWHMSVLKIVGPDAVIDGIIGVNCFVSTLWFDYSRLGFGTVNRVGVKGRSGGPAGFFIEASGPGTATNIRVADDVTSTYYAWWATRISSSYGVDLSDFYLGARGRAGASLEIDQQWKRTSAAGPREGLAGRPTPINISDGHVAGGVFVRHSVGRDENGSITHPIPGHVQSLGAMAYHSHQNVTTEQPGDAHRAALDDSLTPNRGPLPGWAYRATPVDPPAPITVTAGVLGHQRSATV